MVKEGRKKRKSNFKDDILSPLLARRNPCKTSLSPFGPQPPCSLSVFLNRKIGVN